MVSNVRICGFIFVIVLTICGQLRQAHAVMSVGSFGDWLEEFAVEAIDEGISYHVVDRFVERVNFVRRAVKLDRNQPYKVKTFEQYLQSVVPQSRIIKARKKYKQNADLLRRVGKKYKVQPRFIVALWAIESSFGRNVGKFEVIDTLATLAYEGRRASFFRKELLNALKIADQNSVDLRDLKGSWAGAMGQTQFMPSSYLKMAVDFDGDGKKDIWNSRPDVFASIANYLAKTGWDYNSTWGREVKLPKDFDEKLLGRKNKKNLAQWDKMGVRKADGGSLPIPRDRVLQAFIIKPEQDKSRAYIVYDNYETILKWNRSLYFATAVGILSNTMIGVN